jgi:hypothetical protein
MARIALWVAYLGMGVAMVAGATWPAPSWPLVGVGLAIVAVGVVLKRRAGAPPLVVEDQGGAGKRVARRGSLRDGVREAASGIRALAKEAPAMHLEAIKQRVEELQHLGADRIGEAQEAISARLGFAKYAELMAPLATAERLLYRAWSAATDGHRPECLRALGDAVPHADDALAAAEKILPSD